MDTFFSQTKCDRCGKELTDGRTMSMFNTECICLECTRKEKQMDEYTAACDAENAAVRRGEKNFSGVGLPNKK